MTGEEYFERIFGIMKDCKKNSFNHNEGLHGIIPVLSELNKNKDGLTAGDIASKFYISTARVAKMLNYLEEKNYVIRKKDEKDKRITLVSITDLGTNYLNEFKKQRADEMTIAIKDISDSDMEIFFKVTKEIVNNLCRRKVKDDA